MRGRWIKPAFATDGKVMRLSMEARLFYVELWMVADDKGRLPFDIEEVEAQLPHFREKSEPLFRELHDQNLVFRYGPEKQFMQITNWEKHQHPPHARPSKFPSPEKVFEGRNKSKPKRRPKI